MVSVFVIGCDADSPDALAVRSRDMLSERERDAVRTEVGDWVVEPRLRDLDTDAEEANDTVVVSDNE